MNNKSSLLWSDIELGKKQTDIYDEFIKGILTPENENSSKGRISNLLNGKNIGLSYKVLEMLARTTRENDPENGELYTYQNHPIIRKTKLSWLRYIDNSLEREKNLSKQIYDFFNRKYYITLSDNNDQIIFDLSDKLTTINTDDYELTYKLSIFSIIATTWPFWKALDTNDYSGKNRDKVNTFLISIVKMIFPLTNLNTKSDNTSKVLDDSPTPEDRYKEAVSLFEKGDYSEAALCFSYIVNKCLTASNDILGNSYNYLIKCYGNSHTPISSIGTKEELKRWAIHYGSKDIQPRTHEILQKPQPSSQSTKGICIFNELDESSESIKIFDWIIKTKPNKWDYTIFKTAEQLETIFYTQSEPYFETTANIANQITERNEIRFILINKDYSKNLEDSLLILDFIKNLQYSGNYNDNLFENIEIIIRCQEEAATPLLDTACSFLDTSYSPVKIYLIDEKKRNADYLFARHPLFYPLTFSFNKEKAETTETNLVIVSDNSDIEYISWLIRDAFWMLPHSSTKMKSKITILSPYASEIAKYVVAICPGFSKYTSNVNSGSTEKEPLSNPVEINIDDISFPKLEYHTVSLDSRAFHAKIKTLNPADELLYFVVDSTSDLSSIVLGKKIREWLIHNTISSHKLKSYSSDSTVIAIRVWNPDYAGLAQDLIVPKETEHDDFWFNDYKLITFGSLKDIFSWDELTGGAIEFISMCMHIQYCNNDDELYDFTKTPSKKDIQSYFYRLYNRSSSFAAAISIPYRFFEAGVYPAKWHISNNNTYWDEINREALANTFNKLLQDEAKADTGLIEKLSRYEHTRWCCYMLSMGWLPASAGDATYYMNSGVKRHSLQIAKMHPCICSWKELQNLYIDFHFSYNGTTNSFEKPKINKQFEAYKENDTTYFQNIDKGNIKQTANVFKTKQTPQKVRISDEIII